MDGEGMAQDGAKVRGGKATVNYCIKISYGCMRHIAFANL
jgi:hypothetical protein